MYSTWLSLSLLLALGGCVSISSSDPQPPAGSTTIAVPAGSIVMSR
jgi:hypothetical protein